MSGNNIEDPDDVLAKIHEVSGTSGDEGDRAKVILLTSIAISLKRIADAIEGQPGHTPPLEYLAECICRGLREGLQR